MMFRIISKKEYQLLKEQNMERFKELWEMADSEVKKSQEENKELEKRCLFAEDSLNQTQKSLSAILKLERKYSEEAKEYKKLYLDEFQKRMELAVRVREYEKECQKETGNE